MVSHDSSMDPSSSILHQFIISDALTSRPHLEDHRQYTYFQSSGTNRNLFSPPSLGELPSIQSLGERMSRSMDLVQAPAMVEASESGNRRHLMDHLGAANEADHHGQRLSLTLGSHLLVPSEQYRQRSSHSDLVCSGYLIAGDQEHTRNDYSASQNRSSSVSFATESFAAVIGNSRYLKPAQSLLKEVVSTNDDEPIDLSPDDFGRQLSCKGRGSLRISSELKAELCNISADKHDIQIRITKLISLLEQVESRYEQYYHQMEEVESSFEVIAGLGAAKSYTSLAIKAMSRHFCSLRDAILVQINAARRQLYIDLPRTHHGRLSQLGSFDREIRHNAMSLPQLGMIQSHRQPWRPIRGLPENSVAILRSWLFEHFLHPYPNDSEKLTLASQTGLTKNQVSNWFINARVRLWKPMIEEMYKEEFEESSMDSNPSSESSSTRKSVTDH